MFEHLRDEGYKKFKNTYRIHNEKVDYRNTPVNELGVIVQLGYLDVCRTLWGIKNFPEQTKTFKKNGIEFLKDMINNPPNSQKEFDGRHNELCNKCCDINSGIEIHYGQAQKLINMSLKYFYNEYAFYFNKENYLNFPNNNVESYFHLPVDNQAIDYLCEHHKFNIPNKPWSKWPRDDYRNFQNQLNNRLINNYKPLEIDYLIWNNGNKKVTGNAIN